ncbi:PqiC family protein [Rheinheimera sp. MMS21-TC3]|uniref:PqiC family protein n=1 Tax=Rheinheimera sp. MMS21-TC3 TaxID=3072790 RepID=UPI0028C496A4|nr:PqiC family protein [Rheinheimera sp. MMS21-TC3]WNO61934.1 PqiC family protein [Rheinheimera sp. MMS21-TC3]
MRTRIINLALILMLLALTACSSSVSVAYYQLANTEINVAAEPRAESIFLQPVQVANYLNSKSIVMQMSAVELVLARQHLWAEPIAEQIQRKLANTVQALDQRYVIAHAPSPKAITIMLNVDQFHGTAQGYALLQGRYSLKRAELSEQYFTFSYQLPLQADGYPALVLTLSQALEQLASDILLQISDAAAG